MGGMGGAMAGMGGAMGGMGGAMANAAFGSQMGPGLAGAGPGSHAFSGMGFPGGAGGNNQTVLLVSNLDEEQTEPDHLFILFGVYGDVMRVKIMFNKKDTALVQMKDARQA